eukprot:2243086-Amphidinium_carterae.1
MVALESEESYFKTAIQHRGGPTRMRILVAHVLGGLQKVPTTSRTLLDKFRMLQPPPKVN